MRGALSRTRSRNAGSCASRARGSMTGGRRAARASVRPVDATPDGSRASGTQLGVRDGRVGSVMRAAYPARTARVHAFGRKDAQKCGDVMLRAEQMFDVGPAWLAGHAKPISGLRGRAAIAARPSGNAKILATTYFP